MSCGVNEVAGARVVGPLGSGYHRAASACLPRSREPEIMPDSHPTDPDEVQLERRGGLAVVTLNRPKALNALTLGMYRRLDPQLVAWAVDPAIHAVLIRGAGDRAFCAGGDVRAVYEAGQGKSDGLTADFFREEYCLIERVYRFPKPYIALLSGITMGGGAGVSIHGSHRVATERFLFAMPETAIGLFPDVGATVFLNRCPGRIGRYLGLTGVRIKAADALYCGLATHYIPAADTIEGIVAALAAETGDWAREALASLAKASPTSLKITLQQLRMSARLDVAEALQLEYRMTQHVMQRHDFFEGVRAMLVDKDQAPKWQPATLAEVSEDEVAFYFQPIGERELQFTKGRIP